jgi:pimeloyl-ACP methyl ester carboxylesterase
MLAMKTWWGVDEVEVSYATSGDARLAYKVRGTGPHEIVFVPDWVSNQDVEDHAELGLFFERLASFARVVRYDQRGTGLSDPVALDDLPTLEQWTDDLHAVIRASGLTSPVLLAGSAAGPVAVLYAATRPERTRGLILINTYAATAWSDDYPAGVPADVYERVIAYIEREWGTGRVMAGLTPSIDVDEARQRQFARMERLAMAPSTVGAIFRQQYATDVRAVLPVVSAPTLVMHIAENRFIPVAHGRYLAQHIPDARLVELPGSDHTFFNSEDSREAMTDEIEEFVTGTRTETDHSRMLTTLVFTDVVRSTDRVVAIGDRAWLTVLDRHDDAIRRQLNRFSGRQRQFTGDGVLATFDGPARAIRCGTAIRDAARQIGLDVRVGIHTGEVERRGTDLAGVAIHLAHRVCETAAPGEVRVSRTVVDLVAGSGISFDDRGEHALQGIPEPWRLFSVSN